MAKEELGNAKTSVWWDIDKCPVPCEMDPHAIAQNISSALINCECRGPLSIYAFGDTHTLSPNVQRALSSTGVALHHVPTGVKDARDNRILVDMLFWAVDNPAPANYLLITGDNDFANALHQLRMRRYSILLAHPTMNVPPSLSGAAKIIWLWTNLAKGELHIPTLKDTKQQDKLIKSKSLTIGKSKGSSEVRDSLSKLLLKDLLPQNYDSISGVDMKNGTGSLSDFFQSGAQLYTFNSGVEQSLAGMGSANEGRHSDHKTCFPKMSMLKNTLPTIEHFSPPHETRASLPPDSDDTKNLQSFQSHANSRLDSCIDMKYNVCNSKTNLNSTTELSSSCSPIVFSLGSNNVPAKARNLRRRNSSKSTQINPSVSDMIPSQPPEVKPNCLLQVNPSSQMEKRAAPKIFSPAVLRGDMPNFEKMNISSDFEQSSKIQSSTCSSPCSPTVSAPGANNVPVKARNGGRKKSSCSAQENSNFPDIIPTPPPQVRTNGLLQINPNFQMVQEATTNIFFPADLRADMPNFEKTNISSDLQQSSNIQSGTCNSHCSLTASAPGANNVPARARNRSRRKSRQSAQVNPSVPDMIPTWPPQVKHNCLLQVNPDFQMGQEATTKLISSPELRADVPNFEKINISFDSQQSCSSCQIPQLYPSEQNSQFLGNSRPSNVAQTEPSMNAMHASLSKFHVSQLRIDVTYKVHVRIISLAMETLKQNMIASTEENLEDCIRYGERCLSARVFNLREVLDRAVEKKDIVAMSMGGGLKVYIPPDSELWQCVDPLSMHDIYPKKLWDELYKYLSRHEGCQAMVQSKSRYDAAEKLKKSCLNTLFLGQLIHMLHLAIKVRGWLRPHWLGWSPLSITIGLRTG